MFRKLIPSEELDQYIYNYGINETIIEKELREYNSKNFSKTSHIQIGPDLSEILKILIKIGNVKNILELGTYLGYSTLGMALALPANGKITTIDKDEKTTGVAKTFWSKAKVDDKIKLILGDVIKEINQLNEKFDMIFLDIGASKYIACYEKCKSLLTENGFLVIDNVLWRGKVVNENKSDDKLNKIKEFNQHVKNDNYFEISLISIGDGMMLCKKKITK